MSVIEINEIWPGRAGGADLSGERTYDRVFRVITNSKYDTADVVLAHGLIPKIGFEFPTDTQSYCQRVNASQESLSPKVWIVTASYSNKNEVSDDPIDDAPEYEWSTEQFTRPAFTDKDGNGIVNSAGDPYVPAVERDDSRPVVTITRNLESVPTWILDYQDAVNSSSFTIDGISIGARKAKIQSVSVGKEEERNDVTYRTVTIVMHLQKDTWDFEIMDTGFRQKVSSSMEVITNDDGTEITAPVPLDGSGEKLDPPTSGTIVFNTHRVYAELDFNSLPIFG